MDVVGIKLGGSILTYKDLSNFPLDIEEIKEVSRRFIRVENVHRIASELTTVAPKYNLFLGLGVGPFGHVLVNKWEFLKDKDVVHESVSYYCYSICDILKDSGLPVVYDEMHSPNKLCSYDGGDLKVEKIVAWTLVQMKKGKIPVMHGDMVKETGGPGNFDGYTVASADVLIPKVAMSLKEKGLNVRRIVAGTFEDGLYDRDPILYKSEKKLIPIIFPDIKMEDLFVKRDVDNSIVDVTGKMLKKIEEFRRVGGVGIDAWIVNGMVDGRIRDAVRGKKTVGTFIPSIGNPYLKS